MSNGTDVVPTRKPFLSDRSYDALKYFTQIILPALGTLYGALAVLWGLPALAEVVGTVVAVDTFLGIVLHLSTKQYEKTDEAYAGTVGILVHQDGHESVKFNMLTDPEDLPLGQKQVSFKVVPKHAAPYEADDEV
jgi:putative holin Dp-1